MLDIRYDHPRLLLYHSNSKYLYKFFELLRDEYDLSTDIVTLINRILKFYINDVDCHKYGHENN